jgi:predicted enzyme related to lactoylglutathione lyase
MTSNHGHFVWYELLTTDVGPAAAFYHEVLGWSAQDASTPEFQYRVLSGADGPACGLMALPPEARRSGATPRWVGYVAVDDVDACATRLKALGGSIYVPPTDSNIGRISIVADPQGATLALVQGLKQRLRIGLPAGGGNKAGRVGWHELLASEGGQAFAFYNALLGWRKAGEDVGLDGYRLFSAGADVLGGIFTKLPRAPFPFWLYYFNVADLGVALQRVMRHGGRIAQGPVELPDGIWIARCIDPQGAMFALQGKRAEGQIEQAGPVEIGWSAEWGGFASRGRVISKTKISEDKTSEAKPPRPESAAPKKSPPRTRR